MFITIDDVAQLPCNSSNESFYENRTIFNKTKKKKVSIMRVRTTQNQEYLNS